MKAETWLPILSLGLGWGLAQITEVLKDRRASERERLARRAELQRTTLLNLQDALLELINHVLDSYSVESFLARKLESDNKAVRERATKAQRDVLEAQSKVELLASRVQDERARRDVKSFIATTQDALASVEKKAREVIVSELSHSYGHAIQRLGELIRERY